MSALLKFRFRWRANGKDHQTVIEAPSYPEACYKLGRDQGAAFDAGLMPDDFALDLSKPERVE